MALKTTSQWIVSSHSDKNALELRENVAVPAPVGRQCLVRIEAVSLNYRDIAMTLGRFPLTVKDSFVACSDGAGQIIAVGTEVEEFAVGDKVCMTFMQEFEDGILTPQIRKSTLGSQRDGVLRQYGIFEEAGLVSLPKGFSYIEGATLPCAALTAWNCLFGLQSRALRQGDTLLTQGTGGVSLFAIQFALAIGAGVISTTSTAEKAERLKAMGVEDVINYKSSPNWGEAAKAMTRDGLGVHHIIEVGGESTISQTMRAIRPEGVVSMVGYLGGANRNDQASFSLIQQQLCIVRGMNVGPRRMFKEMNCFLEERNIKPVISARIFSFEEAPDAYKEMEKQDFWGKIIIRVG